MSNKYTSVYDWLKYIKANVVGINLRELRLIILSGVNDVERYNEQISVIINDRNAYTHASKKIVPAMNMEQTENVNETVSIPQLSWGNNRCKWRWTEYQKITPVV